jgi:hypothetical protein
MSSGAVLSLCRQVEAARKQALRTADFVLFKQLSQKTSPTARLMNDFLSEIRARIARSASMTLAQVLSSTEPLFKDAEDVRCAVLQFHVGPGG